MKPIYKDYKLTKTGKVLNIPFVSMLRAADGSISTNGIDVDALDCMRVYVERPDLTGVVVVNKNVMLSTHYVVNGDTITLYVGGLPVGESRVKVCAVYGTNTQAIFVARLLVPVGAPGGYDDAETVNVPSVNSVGGAGGADYKTDQYFDAGGRLLVERAEDGSTVIFDEHENPIIKRAADGTTEVYDAYKSVRQGITPHGNVWINLPADGQLSANGSMAQGASGNVASGANSHAEGYGCTASGAASHAEGTATIASGQGSHAEGSSSKTSTCEASGENAHAEGLGTKAIGKNSHAEGYAWNYELKAISIGSHAEGVARNRDVIAGSSLFSGLYGGCHAEGDGCHATGEASHAEGYITTSSGASAHSEGIECVAGTQGAHAEGYHTIASIGAPWGSFGKHAQGLYNFDIDSPGCFMHGCGTSESDRKNALLIVGAAVYMLGVGGYDGTNHDAEGVQSVQEVILGLINSQ